MSFYIKGFAIIVGTALAAACTIVEKDDNADASTGGTTGTGGAGTGGAATGGAGTGGSTGGTTSEAGTDASPDSSPDGAPDGAPDGSACNVAADSGACTACMASKCCSVYEACNDATCEAQLFAMQDCLITGPGDGGVPSIIACGLASDAGAPAANTLALLACMVAPPGDGGPQNCATECFGGPIAP